MRVPIGHKHEIDLAPLLSHMVEVEGSDLLLKVGSPPLVRVRGTLGPVDPAYEVLAAVQTEQLLYNMINTSKIKDFENHGEIDFAYQAPGLGRFRVSGYQQRGAVSIVMRIVPAALQSIESLGLPDVIRRLAEEERGLILVTGGTGSGKSTTLAAMVGHINETQHKHVITIEDPIEYLHPDQHSAIDQREIGSDTISFGSALRRVLRQDPDVILIGEMRDEETVRTGLAAAETGHLVMSTLHTLDAAETINRIIDFFQPHEHQHVRAMLAGTLKGIISQRLAPTVYGQGRVAICEVLTMTGRVHDAILDGGGDLNLADIISEGAHYGMQTFDQALYDALTDQKIDMDTALRVSSHPHDLKLLVQAGGRVSTSMEDLDDSVRMAEAMNGSEQSDAEPVEEETSAWRVPSQEELDERAPDPRPTFHEEEGPPRLAGSVPPPTGF